MRTERYRRRLNVLYPDLCGWDESGRFRTDKQLKDFFNVPTMRDAVDSSVTRSLIYMCTAKINEHKWNRRRDIIEYMKENRDLILMKLL